MTDEQAQEMLVLLKKIEVNTAFIAAAHNGDLGLLSKYRIFAFGATGDKDFLSKEDGERMEEHILRGVQA